MVEEGTMRTYSTTNGRRLGQTTVALLCLLVVSFSLNVTTASAAEDSGNRQLVKVARDITQQARCVLKYNGTEAQCPAGTVVADFAVTKAEAIAAGEDYVAPSGNLAADIGSLNRLMKNVGMRARQQERTTGKSPLVVTGCGYNQVAAYSYDASNFSSPYPAIYVEVHYDVTTFNGVCNSVGVNWSYTDWARTGSNAWLDYTSFNTVGYDVGCPTNIPHTSNYSPPMYGHTGDTFDHGVEQGCNFWNPRIHSSIQLY